MSSAGLLGQVARTAAMAAGARQRMQKRAWIARGAGNFLRGMAGAAPKLATPGLTSAMHTAGKYTANTALAAGGLYGAGMTGYHGLGIGKPPDHQAKFNENSQMMNRLHDQYSSDIDAVEAGTYNPHTGARADGWWSGIFGFQGLTPAERSQQVAAMKAKLQAAQTGTGTLGDYRGNARGWLRNGESIYGTNYDEMRQQALQSAQSGLNQPSYRPGLLQTALLDGTPREVGGDAQQAMQSFITKYGPKAAKPATAAQRFSYIGGRPAGPVDFSHLGLGSGFGHDYSGYYQPYGMVQR